MRVIAAAWLVLVAIGDALAEEGAPAASELRNAVVRSLPYLEQEGVKWIKGRGCMSCHVFSFTIWSHREALARGIPVDRAKLAEWTGWAKDESLRKREWFKFTEQSLQALAKENLPAEIVDKLQPLRDKPFVTRQELVEALAATIPPETVDAHRSLLIAQAAQPKSAKNDGGGLDTVYQLILAEAPAATGAADAAWQQALLELVRQWQEQDGSWKAAGQLPRQNRPAAESNEVTSGWALLALAYSDPQDAETKKCIDSALIRRRQVKPGKSLESLLVCYLIERKLGSPELASSLLEQVRQRQNSDGGWSWLPNAESDAFATGQTLYALTLAEMASTDPAIQRAQRFLLGTQAEDGSWSVQPKSISSSTEAGRVKRLEPIYRSWGTAWAVIGLSRTLPPTGN